MFKFRIVAFCPEMGLSLLIVNYVHYYLHSRLVTAVRVYIPPLPHPHSSKPAGRALQVLTIAFTNSGLVFLLPSSDHHRFEKSFSQLSSVKSTLISPH